MEKFELIVLPEKWINILISYPADRGGYQTGIIKTNSGGQFRVGISNATYIYYVEGFDHVPFSETDIEDITVTNEMLNEIEWSKRGHYVCQQGFLKEPFPTKSIPRKET